MTAKVARRPPRSSSCRGWREVGISELDAFEVLGECAVLWKDGIAKATSVGTMPRNLRTPLTEAGRAFVLANEFWLEFLDYEDKRPGRHSIEFDDPEGFFFTIFERCFSETEADIDILVYEVLPKLENYYLTTMFQAIAFAARAMRLEKLNEHEVAWVFACDAVSYAEALLCCWEYEKNPKNPAAGLAKMRNAQFREDALEWLHQNGGAELKPEEAGEKLWLKYSQAVEAETYTRWIRADRPKKSKQP